MPITTNRLSSIYVLDQLGVHGVDVVDLEGDPAPGGALGEQLADLLGGLRVVRRWAGTLQQDLAVVTGRLHGEPAHEPEVGVGADLQTEDADVEVEGLVLVEDEEGREAWVAELHARNASGRRCRPASPKPTDPPGPTGRG